MAWVHGLYRTRRRVNHDTEQDTSEDDEYDRDICDRFELGGRLRSELNLIV